jgi:type 1 fimbria pilin
MANQDIDSVFTALQIRNTSVQTSSVSASGEFMAKTLVIDNGLNQTVTLQLQGSDDNTLWLNVGATFDVTATTADYQTVADFFPYYRLTAVCSVAPTTGDLDVRVLKAQA